LDFPKILLSVLSMPLHLQDCFGYLGYKEGDFPISEKISKEIISLTMNPYMSDGEIKYICEVFCERIGDENKRF